MKTPKYRLAHFGLVFAMLLVGVVTLSALSGCSGTSSGLDPVVEAQRKKLMLETEPEVVTTLTETKAELTEASEATSKSVALAAEIRSGDEDPFTEGKAIFVVTELYEDDHSHGPGGADNCPFCKHRRSKLPTAVVQFVDDQGKVIEHDARQLFEVEKGQIVVLQGEVELVPELNNLVRITATGVHVRR